MKLKVKRPPEVEAAIKQAEDDGDYVRSGYLMAPGLHTHTGDSPEEMLKVCALLKQMDGMPPDFHMRNEGVERWANEQISRIH